MGKSKAADFEKVDSFRVGIVVSTYNRQITKALQEGAYAHLIERGVRAADILVVEVPGAVEIPLTAQWLITGSQVDVVISLGAVIRGETSHYDLVCQAVTNGCQEVALTHNTPVVLGVLTTENEGQCWDRLGGKHGHKGVEAADCAIKMYELAKQYRR